MRYVITSLVFCALLFSVLSVQADYVQAVKNDGPVAYWRIEEAAGATQLSPEAGFGTVFLNLNDGTRALAGAINDTPPQTAVPGAPLDGYAGNKAVFLPNLGPYPVEPCRWEDCLKSDGEIDLSGTGGWTFEVWFRHADANAAGYSWGADSDGENLLGNGDMSPHKDRIMFEIDSYVGTTYLPRNFRLSTDYDVKSATPVRTLLEAAIPEGVYWDEWHHVVATTLDGIGSVYMDGNLVGSMPWNGTWTSTSEPMSLGLERAWKGDLDEIVLYNKGLTAEQVQSHFQASGYTPTPKLPGDANLDRTVNELDAAALANNWLTADDDVNWAMGDFNDDDVVDDIDATILAANWGSTAPAQSVPEPGMGVVLISVVLTGLLLRKRSA